MEEIWGFLTLGATYKIRVPNLYIWGRKRHWEERDVGEKKTL